MSIISLSFLEVQFLLLFLLSHFIIIPYLIFFPFHYISFFLLLFSFSLVVVVEISVFVNSLSLFFLFFSIFLFFP
jgi:hypothetical protein